MKIQPVTELKAMVAAYAALLAADVGAAEAYEKMTEKGVKLSAEREALLSAVTDDPSRAEDAGFRQKLMETSAELDMIQAAKSGLEKRAQTAREKSRDQCQAVISQMVLALEAAVDRRAELRQREFLALFESWGPAAPNLKIGLPLDSARLADARCVAGTHLTKYLPGEMPGPGALPMPAGKFDAALAWLAEEEEIFAKGVPAASSAAKPSGAKAA